MWQTTLKRPDVIAVHPKQIVMNVDCKTLSHCTLTLDKLSLPIHVPRSSCESNPKDDSLMSRGRVLLLVVVVVAAIILAKTFATIYFDRLSHGEVEASHLLPVPVHSFPILSKRLASHDLVATLGRSAEIRSILWLVQTRQGSVDKRGTTIPVTL